MKRKIHSQSPSYCDQCRDFHAHPCPTPDGITKRCAAERAKWTPLEAERREMGKPQPVELAEYQRPRRVVKVELGRR